MAVQPGCTWRWEEATHEQGCVGSLFDWVSADWWINRTQCRRIAREFDRPFERLLTREDRLIGGSYNWKAIVGSLLVCLSAKLYLETGMISLL